MSNDKEVAAKPPAGEDRSLPTDTTGSDFSLKNCICRISRGKKL